MPTASGDTEIKLFENGIGPLLVFEVEPVPEPNTIVLMLFADCYLLQIRRQ